MLHDFFSECNNLSVSEQEFKAVFCDRCRQPECVRSVANRSGSYEDRVRNWKNRLVTVPVKVDPAISTQDFREVNETRWADPHSLPKVSSAVPAKFDLIVPPINKVDPLTLVRKNTPNPGPVTLAGGMGNEPPGGGGERTVPPGAKIVLE